MIIDGHAHAAGDFADADKLVETLDRLGIAVVALCPGMKNNTSVWPLPNIPVAAIKRHPLYSRYFIHPGIWFSYNYVFRDKGNGNEFVRSIVQRHPDRVVQVYWADPRKPGFMREMEGDHERWHFGGIKLHQACTPFTVDADEVDQIAGFAGRNRLPIFIHLWSGKETRRLAPLMVKHRDTNFVLLHLTGVEELSNYTDSVISNVYFDISPYSYISEKRIRFAVGRYGADHVVFGSDTPWDGDSQRRVIERVKNMDLSDSQKEEILGANLAKLLALRE